MSDDKKLDPKDYKKPERAIVDDFGSFAELRADKPEARAGRPEPTRPPARKEP